MQNVYCYICAAKLINHSSVLRITKIKQYFMQNNFLLRIKCNHSSMAFNVPYLLLRKYNDEIEFITPEQNT